MTTVRSRQALRRWGNSLGVRLTAAIVREARFQDDQAVELQVVEDGVLIRPIKRRLLLQERLDADEPRISDSHLDEVLEIVGQLQGFLP